MSDRIAVMHRGRVEQVAPPRGLYETPATAFVAGFIGNINLLSGRAAGSNTVDCGGATLAATGAAPAGATVAVALRPERIRLDPSAALDTVLPMTVAHVVYQGETVRYILKSEAGLELQAVELGEVRFAAGSRVRAGWAAADARIIQEERDMTKVGLITVGQSPRSDVVPDMAAILGGDVEIVEAGALDGLEPRADRARSPPRATTRSSSPGWPTARRSSSGRRR